MDAGGAAPHTTTADRYLEAVFHIAAEGDVVRPGRLSHWLQVSAPTVSEALRRLERDGWVVLSPDRSVALTEEGARVAEAIVRRHRVLERWLTDVLGLDWASADVEAERLAAATSDEVIDRIDLSMGRPATCPHGNVIPGRRPDYGDLVALSDLAAGRRVRVRRVSEVAEHEGQPLLRELTRNGIGEGSSITVLERTPDGAVVEVEPLGARVSLDSFAVGTIWVEVDGSAVAPH